VNPREGRDFREYINVTLDIYDENDLFNTIMILVCPDVSTRFINLLESYYNVLLNKCLNVKDKRGCMVETVRRLEM
jgi:hypothetical protein